MPRAPVPGGDHAGIFACSTGVYPIPTRLSAIARVHYSTSLSYLLNYHHLPLVGSRLVRVHSH